MASNPSPAINSESTERPLTQDEWWDLLWSLEGSMEGWFPEEGGASGVLLREREAWANEALSRHLRRDGTALNRVIG